MARVTDKDRDQIQNTININSDDFLCSEVQRIHEIALELDAIRHMVITRIDKKNVI
jgi:hypothetical protein